jgi:hypothetical protein
MDNDILIKGANSILTAVLLPEFKKGMDLMSSSTFKLLQHFISIYDVKQEKIPLTKSQLRFDIPKVILLSESTVVNSFNYLKACNALIEKEKGFYTFNPSLIIIKIKKTL